jgi:hypothetical protein
MTKLLGKSGSYEKIVAFMKDDKAEVELTDHEKGLVTRWMEAFTLMRNYNTTADAVAILMKRFPDLSRATAYRDCANAISLFGDISKSTKEGIRHLTTEIVKDALTMARAMNDPGEMRLCALAIARIQGVNDTDADAFNWEELEPHTYELAIDDVMLKALRFLIKGGKIDLTMVVDAMNATAEDAVIIEDAKEIGNA